jgi:putative acetyltransferase
VQKQIVIRPFRRADQPAAQDLILRGLGEHFGFIDAALNPDLDNIWGHYMTQGSLFFIAERYGDIVATGALIREAGAAWRIVRVSVAPAQRRQGIGEQITHHLIAAARDLGGREILVETNEDWSAAIALYQRCGFTIDEYRDGECHLRLSL